MINNLEISNHLVRSLVDTFRAFGKKNCLKGCNETCHVLSQAVVNKNTRNIHFMRTTSKLVKVNVKTLQKYSIRRENIGTTRNIEFWALIGRSSHFNKDLIEVVHGIMKKIWHDNTRHSSNQKDVLKLGRSYQYR